jgi:hypothetical protein
VNIFYLDKDPIVAAQMSCDKHVCKMIVESAQMLSTAHRMIDGTQYTGKTKNGRNIKRWKHPNSNLEETLYLACHTGHPSTLWVMQSAYNYHWLYKHMMALNTEFKMRYGHIQDHKSIRLLEGALMYAPKNIPLNKIATDPTPAMPDYCKIPGDVVESYRKYYCLEKTRFATWKSPATIPLWFSEGVKYYQNTAEI